MPNPAAGLNLDAYRAAKAEAVGGGFPVTLGGEKFTFPAELPIDVLEPLMPVLPEVFELIGPVLDRNDKDNDAFYATLRKVLSSEMPMNLVNGLSEAVQRLMNTPEDPEVWVRFKAKRPTVEEASSLAKALWGYYGVSLGELFGSVSSALPAGATSSQTSNGSTSSTPELPSSPEAPASASVG